MSSTWIFIDYAYLTALFNSSSKPSAIGFGFGEMVDSFEEFWFAALTVAIPFGPGILIEGSGGGGGIAGAVFGVEVIGKRDGKTSEVDPHSFPELAAFPIKTMQSINLFGSLTSFSHIWSDMQYETLWCVPCT